VIPLCDRAPDCQDDRGARHKLASTVMLRDKSGGSMLHRRDGNSEIDNLEKLSRAELRVLWEKEFGGKAPRMLGRDILALGIAYARQERSYGGLARPVAKELDRLLARVLQDEAADAPRAATSPLPRTGTTLVREWRGTTHRVTVVDDGFRWNGKTHQSLSSIARAITGTNWNGPRFFGMREPTKPTPEERRGR
jgi:Protein of unknown function (DUF2924)